MTKKILIIKLGDLAEFIQMLPAAKLVRERHVGARITLLTTEPYQAFAERCPLFDLVEADGRPRDAKGVVDLIARIRAARYDMVYDFHTSQRTNNYFLALKPNPPPWSGTAPSCAYFHNEPDRARMNASDRMIAQVLAVAGARDGQRRDAPPPDLSWVRRAWRDPPRLQPEFFGLKHPYVLLVPAQTGWPDSAHAALAQKIAARGAIPAIVGGAEERDRAAAIARAEPKAKNLVLRADLFQIAALAERAAFAVGEASGLMHLAAAAGAPSLVLFARAQDPERNAPRSRRGAATLTADALEELPVSDVERALQNLGAFANVRLAS
ncbi:MAG: lipopolysaccharide heptosyltransferase family protein [Alphaproteobacteria bacterium]|nr:lipopolysaccharide heptosyltransferase family protein [Alphaproteobacteria bacterium]